MSEITCCYNGKKGAYAEQAVIDYFGDEAQAVSVKSFDEIFESVLSEKSNFGMVPIENCTAGSVYQNYDNITRYKDVSIVAATTIRIEHSLMACKNASLDSIKIVTSHPQALGQCSEFIKKHNFKQEEANSTAEGAELVSKLKSSEYGAIANARNAELYGLQILQQGIENNPNNYTRFVIIASNKVIRENRLVSKIKGQKPNMVSIVFTTKNEPGALYNVLGIFKDHNVNLNRLESRPIVGQPWKYWFYIDGKFDDSVADYKAYVDELLEHMKAYTEDVRLLGTYREI